MKYIMPPSRATDSASSLSAGGSAEATATASSPPAPGTDTSAGQLLKSVFGYENCRPRQRAIIKRLESGRHALFVMPTGGGKSWLVTVAPALPPTNPSAIWSRAFCARRRRRRPGGGGNRHRSTSLRMPGTERSSRRLPAFH